MIPSPNQSIKCRNGPSGPRNGQERAVDGSVERIIHRGTGTQWAGTDRGRYRDRGTGTEWAGTDRLGRAMGRNGPQNGPEWTQICLLLLTGDSYELFHHQINEIQCGAHLQIKAHVAAHKCIVGLLSISISLFPPLSLSLPHSPSFFSLTGDNIFFSRK